VHCLYEPPESRHTPCPPLLPSSYLSPSTNRARHASHEEIHETSFAVERFGSSRLIEGTGKEGEGEEFREVTRTRLACRRRGAGVPRLFSCRRWRNRPLFEKVETDIENISFLRLSASLAKTLTADCRFEGYGVIGFVKRRDREESRERERERERERKRTTGLWSHNLGTNIRATCI